MNIVGSFLIVLVASLIGSSLQQSGNCDCKKKERCKPWVDAIKQGKYLNLPVCGFDEHPHTPLLCCPRGRMGKRSVHEESAVDGARGVQNSPQSKLTSSANKAALKCAEFAEAVFQEVSIPLDPTGVHKVDTCEQEASWILIPQASPRNYPHQALIGYGSGQENITWVCGATLISERFVITSAFCSHPPSKLNWLTQWVKLGEGDRRGSIPQVYRVIERIEHPESDKRSLHSDIALLRLEKDVKFSPTVRPACVYSPSPAPEVLIFPFLDGDDSLSKIGFQIMKLVGNDKCSEVDKSLAEQGVDETIICARHHFRGKYECQQMLGSSMVLKLKKPYCMHAVVGVTSMVNACGEETVAGTRVAHYLPWIVDHVWPE